MHTELPTILIVIVIVVLLLILEEREQEVGMVPIRVRRKEDPKRR